MDKMSNYPHSLSAKQASQCQSSNRFEQSQIYAIGMTIISQSPKYRHMGTSFLCLSSGNTPQGPTRQSSPPRIGIAAKQPKASEITQKSNRKRVISLTRGMIQDFKCSEMNFEGQSVSGQNPGWKPSLPGAILKDVIEVNGLGKKYGSRWILRDLTFSLSAGDCLIVTGKNGAGKSTLLKLLSGLERPTTGTVKTETTDYRTELSYCALDQATFANLTVTEHLSLAAKMRGIQSEDSTLIHNCGLNEHKDHQAQYLSSGLRSRLKIAIAIQSNPKILLWDEPGVALDGAGKALIERIIGEQKQRGVLVIATKDLDERRFGTHELELV